MKTMSKTGVVLLASGLVLVLFASAVEAGSRKVTREGPRGGSVEKSWTRGGGTATRDVTKTGPRGASVEKSVTRGGGTATRDVTRTGPGGKSFQRSSERVVDRENQSVTKSSSTTYRDGTTSQGSWTVTRNEDGSYSVEGERTNRAGETKSFSGTVTSE